VEIWLCAGELRGCSTAPRAGLYPAFYRRAGPFNPFYAPIKRPVTVARWLEGAPIEIVEGERQRHLRRANLAPSTSTAFDHSLVPHETPCAVIFFQQNPPAPVCIVGCFSGRFRHFQRLFRTPAHNPSTVRQPEHRLLPAAARSRPPSHGHCTLCRAVLPPPCSVVPVHALPAHCV
jgi:hypothetical protein